MQPLTNGQSSGYVIPNSTVRPGFASQAAKVLGSTQVVIGTVCFMFQIMGIVLHSGLANAAEGIWGGVVFIIAGGFGIGSSQRKTNCMIITFMVMSIIGAVTSTCAMVLACGGIIIDKNHYSYYHNSSRGGRLAVDCILLILLITELAAAIWSAVVCCKAVCCLPGLGMTGDYNMPYHVEYIATGVSQQPVVFMPPSTAHPGGVLYTMPQVAAPLIVQQGAMFSNQGSMLTTRTPIYNPPSSNMAANMLAEHEPLNGYTSYSHDDGRQPDEINLKV